MARVVGMRINLGRAWQKLRLARKSPTAWIYSGAGESVPIPELPGLDNRLLSGRRSIAPRGFRASIGVAVSRVGNGNLMVAALASKRYVACHGRVMRWSMQESPVQGTRQSFSDVRSGPDGALYLLTDCEDGKLLKVVPAN